MGLLTYRIFDNKIASVKEYVIIAIKEWNEPK